MMQLCIHLMTALLSWQGGSPGASTLGHHLRSTMPAMDIGWEASTAGAGKGERVVRRRENEPGPTAFSSPNDQRRVLLIGAAVFGVAGLSSTLGVGAQRAAREPEEETALYYDDGDCVTPPGLEVELEAAVANAAVAAGSAAAPADAETVRNIVLQLEAAKGSQFAAAFNQGRWVIPWVGGWERVWADDPDASFVGGPARASLALTTDRTRSAPVMAPGGDVYRQGGARLFVYGPGVDGACVEYTYEASGVRDKLLLTRTGSVDNEGGNVFRLAFASPFKPYEVTTLRSADGEYEYGALPTFETLPTRGIDLSQAAEVECKTTYLSERLWVVCGADGEIAIYIVSRRGSVLTAGTYLIQVRGADGQLVVWRRTETRRVEDRRGLVADGQLKPNADESIRYGRLSSASEIVILHPVHPYLGEVYMCRRALFGERDRDFTSRTPIPRRGLHVPAGTLR